MERWAFFSLTDKTGAVEDARRLVALGWKILSAGGTCKMLADAGIPVMDLADLVGGGSALNHKVLSLSRKLYMSILADTLDPNELAELVAEHLPFVDLVRCNFYDLPTAIAEAAKMTDRSAAIAYVIRKTDVGGPCMIHAADKSLRIPVYRKCDMESVLQELEATGDVSQENRQKLRARGEYEVARYIGHSAMFHGDGQFKVITGERVRDSFKGENGPQTPATLYSTGSNDPLALEHFKLLGGSAPSYNNWRDVGRLLQTASHIEAGYRVNYDHVPRMLIGNKHGNACNAAIADNEFDAIRHTIEKSRAIFGGVLLANFPITATLAMAMAEAMPQKKALFDGVIAPSFTEEAVVVLSRKHGKCRIMANPALADGIPLDTVQRFCYDRGTVLTQPNYTYVLNFCDPEMKVYGPRIPAAEKDLVLAWGVGCASNSNTITIAGDGSIWGNGCGRMDRVGAAELAIKLAVEGGKSCNKWLRRWLYAHNFSHKAGLDDAAVFSDSFFPFNDAIEVLIDAGVRAIFSTSGSVNDAKAQELCLKRGVTLYQLPDAKARGFFHN